MVAQDETSQTLKLQQKEHYEIHHALNSIPKPDKQSQLHKFLFQVF